MEETDGGKLSFKKLGRKIRKTAKKTIKQTKRITLNMNDDIVKGANNIADAVEKKVNQSVNLVDKIIFGSDELSPQIIKYLKKNGHLKIKSLTLGRSPVPAAIYAFLDIASKKGVKQDILYHLYLIITLENGKKISIEKNERIALNTSKIAKPSHTLPISGNIDFSLDEMINNTKNLMGKQKFIQYSVDNNCQVFIKSILESNKLLNAENLEFVKQDTQDIWEGRPQLRKIANTVVGIAGRANIAFGGELIKKTITKKQLSKPNNMTKNELENNSVESIDGGKIKFGKLIKSARKSVNSTASSIKKETAKAKAATKREAKKQIAELNSKNTKRVLKNGSKSALKTVAKAAVRQVIAAPILAATTAVGQPQVGAIAASYVADKVAKKYIDKPLDKGIKGLGLQGIMQGGNISKSKSVDNDNDDNQVVRGKGQHRVYIDKKRLTKTSVKNAIERRFEQGLQGGSFLPANSGYKGGSFLPA